MIINGEKWACEACVRGHRVSNCQHSDRRLQHINRKGRPVSQCQHCRALRKSRSAHVKCDCGSKNKCIHLQPTVEGHKETCCCSHGGKCTCAPKESMTLEAVPETEREPGSSSASRSTSSRRRRANTNSSEGISPQASRHKTTTTAKKRLSQKGSITRVNSVTETVSSMVAGLPRPCSSNSHHVESELSSPNMGNSPTFSHGLAPAPLDLSRISCPTYHSSALDLFGSSGFSADHDLPLSSAGLMGPSDTWSTSDYSVSSYRMAQSFGSTLDYERFPNLASTGASSGDVSEVDENFMAGDEDGFPSTYMTHQSHIFNQGHHSNVGKYMSNVGSFDDEIFALRYNDHTSSMPNSPEDHSSFDYLYHYGV